MSLDSSNPEATASQNPESQVDQAKIPHSGEAPAYNLDEMTLREAIDRGIVHDVEVDETGQPVVHIPDTLGEVREPQSSQPTEAFVPFDTPTEETPKRRIGKKGIAAITASALATGVIAGLGAMKFMGGDETAPDREQTSTSGTPNTEGDPEVSTPANPEAEPTTSLIEGLKKKATPEQIEFVKNNPLTIAEAPTLSAALTQIGDRLNVMLNSGEYDYEVGDQVTPASQNDLYEMASAVLIPEDPAYEAIMESIQARRLQISAMMGDPTLGGDPTAESQLTLRNTGADATLKAGQHYTTSAEEIMTTNRPDTQSGDGEYNDDYSYDGLTIIVTDEGEIYLAATGTATNIGNIG